MRYRFIHASDLHLDTPFKGLGGLAPELAGRLRDASLDALDRIVDKALEVDAAFVLFAGDVYDGEERGVRAQLRFRAALGRLSRHGVQSFVAHGNHDPEAGRWSAIRSWPEGVTVFPARSPSSVLVRRGGRALATVHGVSYGTRHERDNLALRFPVVASAGGDLGAQIAVLHTSVRGSEGGHASYSPCTLEELRSRGMTYWALGHVHRHEILSREPWVVYSGSTQGRSFAASERGERGALIVDMDGQTVTDITHFATDSARFLELSVDLADAADLGDLLELLQARAEALSATHPGVSLLLRGRLRGRSALHQEIKSPPRLAELLSSLADLSSAHLWWLGLDDHAGPALDLARIRQAGDLRAALLSTVERWRGGGALNLPAPLTERLAKVGPPGLGSRVELEALIEEATFDLLERLSPAEEP